MAAWADASVSALVPEPQGERSSSASAKIGLCVSGHESELPFAGLHQLLWPVLDRVDGLPEVQRDALHADPVALA